MMKIFSHNKIFNKDAHLRSLKCPARVKVIIRMKKPLSGHINEITSFLWLQDTKLIQTLTTPHSRSTSLKMMSRITTVALLVVLSHVSAHTICHDEAVVNSYGASIASTVLLEGDGVAAGLLQYATEGITVGSTMDLIPEANDASRTPNTTVMDGKSGDTDFPHGNLKAIATVGERSVCDESKGEKITGVPDGLGAYLVDDHTVRVIVQSESYGPLRYETFKFPVNGGAANFTGSHVQYVDYDRDMLGQFMHSDKSAAEMVVGMGEMIETAYNLKGEMIGARNGSGPTTFGAHYGNTDVEGNYVASAEPSEADWFYQSFCSAHMEQKHQWGEGIGLEDDIFITNEEWHSYEDGQMFVGLGAHAVDVHTKTAYAVGAFSQGGFEKIVEINSQHPDYVMFAVSGYNGAFSGTSAVHEARNAEFTREDGSDYVWPSNVVPFRIYVGMKGKCEDGSDCDDFLARNGLKYGKMYGFAIDMSSMGPSKGLWRDEFHRNTQWAKNGAKVPGKWIAQSWQWDGKVKNFQYDGSWDFQNDPSVAGYKWWNPAGYDAAGSKTEHNSPDPREGKTGFVQTSTAGYFGHLYVNDVTSKLAMGGLPDHFDGDYYVYQGERDITKQIRLGGKGLYADGKDALRNWDDASGDGKVTFEDIDGFEVFQDGGKLYAMIQEDSGNDYGERMFITSALEHKQDKKWLHYYFVAMSGGSDNTRMSNGVGIPAGVSCGGSSHEFSGLFDMSGLLKMDGEGYALSSSDSGHVKREADKMVSINDKTILVGLQAHNMYCGVIKYFGADRGGQWLLYQPHIPMRK